MMKFDISREVPDLRTLVDHVRSGETVYITDGAETFRLESAPSAGDDPEGRRPGRGSWRGLIHFAPDWDVLDAESKGLGPDGDFA